MADELDYTGSMLDNMNKEVAKTSAPGSQPFLSGIEVNRMFIEPEEYIFDKQYNRNLQMGYIKYEDQPILQMKWETAKLLADVPASQGQFLFAWMAGINVDSVNFKLVSSNSIDGKGRLSMLTRVIKQESKDTTTKGGVSSFFRPSDSN